MEQRATPRGPESNAARRPGAFRREPGGARALWLPAGAVGSRMATRQGESGAAALADLARPTIDGLAVPGAAADAPRLPRVPFASSLGLLAATVPLLLFLVVPLGVL